MSTPKFSLDGMVANDLPKLFRLADDMHAMTSYMNDLRIVAILGMVLGILGGIGFLLFKLSFANKSAEYDPWPSSNEQNMPRGRYVEAAYYDKPQAFHYQKSRLVDEHKVENETENGKAKQTV